MPGLFSGRLCLGNDVAGITGALAAFVALTFPSALILLVFAITAASISDPVGTRALHGLKIVAIVAQAVWVSSWLVVLVATVGRMAQKLLT